MFRLSGFSCVLWVKFRLTECFEAGKTRRKPANCGFMSEPNETLTALQARVETLEQQLAHLKARLDKTIPNPNYVNTNFIEASAIRLKLPGSDNQRIFMCAHETGSFITLFDGHSRARLCLKVDEGLEASEDEDAEPGEISLQIYGLNAAGETQNALRLGLNDNNGAVEVHTSTGQPAVLIKGLGENGGAVGVVDETGQICALLRREAQGGQLLLFRPDFQRGAMLHAGPTGGILALSEGGQSKGAVLASVAGGSFLALHKDESEGGCGVRIMANDDIASVKVTDNTTLQAASISATPVHAFIDIERAPGPDGQEVRAFQASTLESGNMLSLMRPDGSKGVMIQSTDASAMIVGEDKEGQTRFMLAAGDSTNGLWIKGQGEDGKNESLIITSHEQVSLTLNSDNKPVVVLDSTDHCGRVAVLGPRDCDKQVAIRATAASAGLIISETSGEAKAQLWADDESGHFELSYDDGTPRVHLHANKEGGGVIVAGDSGNARAGLAVNEDHGQILVVAAGGDPVVLINATDDGGQLTLFDEDGERTLSLPDDATLL